MLKKLIALGAFAAATVVVPASAVHADDGYSPKIPTQTQISARAKAPGVPVILTVSASANTATPPEGDIAVQVTAASGAARTAQAVMAAPLFTTTVHFVDEPVRITGPSLPRGRYLASAAFTPDDSNTYLPSRNSTAFRVGAGAGGDGGENGGGALPDTGGPNLMWLLLGSGLVVTGAGSVTYARRRETATA